MYDHPTIAEMIDSIRTHLEKQVVPAVNDDPNLHYQTLVAVSLLQMIEREMQIGTEQLQEEWKRLNFVQRINTPFPDTSEAAQNNLAERNRKLCEEIQAGRYDFLPQQAALYEHLLLTTRRQIEVSNPKFLEKMAEEDKKSS